MPSSFTNLFSTVLWGPNSLCRYPYKSTEAKQVKWSLKWNKTMQIGFISYCVLCCSPDCFPLFVVRLLCYVHHQIQGKEPKTSGLCERPPGEFTTTQDGFETSQRREKQLPGDSRKQKHQTWRRGRLCHLLPSAGSISQRQQLLAIPEHRDGVP